MPFQRNPPDLVTGFPGHAVGPREGRRAEAAGTKVGLQEGEAGGGSSRQDLDDPKAGVLEFGPHDVGIETARPIQHL